MEQLPGDGGSGAVATLVDDGGGSRRLQAQEGRGYPFTGIQEATEIRSAVSVLGDTSVRTEGKGVRISEEGAGS